jgi:hypothetical protein
MIISEILLIILLILAWLYGIYTHNMNGQPKQDLIKLPKAVGLLFGGYKRDGFLNFKSLFAQITFLLLAVVISLINFSLITRQQGYHILAWSVSVLAILIITISIYKDRK